MPSLSSSFSSSSLSSPHFSLLTLSLTSGGRDASAQNFSVTVEAGLRVLPTELAFGLVGSSSSAASSSASASGGGGGGGGGPGGGRGGPGGGGGVGGVGGGDFWGEEEEKKKQQASSFTQAKAALPFNGYRLQVG